MSGLEPLIASLAAAAAEAGAAVGATATAGAGAATTAAAAQSAALLAGTGGLTTTGALSAAGAAASAAGTGAQLLAGTPSIKIPKTPTIDDATREANERANLLKRKGRAAALLTEGGGRGLTSSPSLGAAALLGS